MSDDEYRIMNILADDASERVSPEHVRGMLQELRQFVNDESSPSMRNFEEWADSSHKSYKHHFGSWRNAVAAVGEEPNRQYNRVTEEEVLQAIDNAAEQRHVYTVDGKKRVSPEGEAPPGADLRHIEEIDVGETTINQKFDRSYTELAEGRGYDTQNNHYDWDEVEETLRGVIQEKVFFRAGDAWIPEGEMPPNEYLDRREDLPSLSSIRRMYGPREDWLVELGLEEERNAEDVDVDLSEFDL